MVFLLRTELQKILLQRSLFMAGFLAPPAFALLVKILMQVVVFRRVGRSDLPQEVDVLAGAARAFSLSGNTLAHLFFALGVASIFIVDYRFSTWRHLVPRRSRISLWLAKFLTAALCLAFSLLLVAAGDAVISSLIATADGRGFAPLFQASSIVLFVLAFLTAMLELLVLTALTALVTISMRSSMAGVLTAFLLTLAATILQAYLGPTQDLWWLPSEAASLMRSSLFSSSYREFGGAASVLAGWLVVLGGLGLAIFTRQELANE